MFRLGFVALLGLSLALGACSSKKGHPDDGGGKSSGDNSNQGEQKPSDSQNLYASLFQVDFVEASEPNTYKMQISWPADIGKISLQYGQGPDKSEVFVFDTTNTFQATVSGGTPVDFEIKSLEVSSIVGFSANPPKDLIVNSILELTQNSYWTYNRVYFNPGGTIVTSGFDLTLNAKKILVSDKITADKRLSQILTTRHTAPHTVMNPKEYAGSNIVINSQMASGVLRIGMLGIDGENGLAGSVISPSPSQPDPTLNGADGSPAVASFFKCKVQPTNGKNGKAGAQGTSGGNAKNGGNTGNLALVIADNDDLQVILTAKAGVGGQGGRGAPGGPGGKGGKAGALDKKKLCKPARNGYSGPQGPRGKDGMNGKAGQVGTLEYSGIKNIRRE